jgi:polysaccharide biosynthesis/export protein
VYKIALIIFTSLKIIMGQSNISQTQVESILNQSGLNIDEAKSLFENQSGLKIDSDIDKNASIEFDSDNRDKTLKQIKEADKLESAINIDADVENDNNISENINDVPSDKKLVDDEIIFDNVNDLEYFGYNTFLGNPENFQNASNLSVDPTYLIGPGDEIIIMLWGETELNKAYTVTKDGYLFFENIGQVFVNGLNLEKLENKLFRIFKKAYASLDPISGTATTFFDVSMGSLVLRPVRVFAMGEVEQPGAYNVKSSSSLFTSLYYFNGPTTKGSLRNIKLFRKEKEIGSIDFYDYLLKGKKNNDSFLKRDDVIFIPQREKTVSVFGEINRQGIYELKSGEGLFELIEIAGGPKTSTYMKRVKIDRILSPVQRIKSGVDRTVIDVELHEILNESINFELFDGDVIEFFEISNVASNIVSIGGAVSRPGIYNYSDGLNLLDLIKKADGLTNDAFLDRADITRTNLSNNQLELLTVNLGEALNGDNDQNIVLKSNDVVNVHLLSSMLYKTNVSIKGHVLYPGPKPFMNNMTVSDLIFLGGGLKNELHLKNAYLDRAELSRLAPGNFQRESIIFRLDSVLTGKGIAQKELIMGDEIYIYSKNMITGFTEFGTVFIEGFVKRPGEYVFHKNMTLKDLLFKAGGIDDFIHRKSMILDRIDIIRLNDDNKSKKLISIDISKNFNDSSLSDGYYQLNENDKVIIYNREMFNSELFVTISGSITNPGNYDFKNGMTLNDIILEAGGVPNIINRFKTEITRKNNNSNYKYSKLIEAEFINDYNSIVGASIEKNDLVYVKPFDNIIIRPDPFGYKNRSVTISGQVKYPGTYPIISSNDKITEIIERAGGLTDDAYPRSSRLIRDSIEIKVSFEKIIYNSKSKYNFIVKDGDEILINGRPNLITIRGAVNNPGNYQYLKGYRLNDYIEMAGGYSINASRAGTRVDYPDGNSAQLKIFNFAPRVYDGSTIVVETKEVAPPFNFTDYVTNLTSIYADLTQAYLMIILAGR